MVAKGTKASARGRRPLAPFRLLKGIALVVVAALALVAGIYKGGEGIFFGAVFAMGFGLFGILSLARDNKRTKTRRR